MKKTFTLIAAFAIAALSLTANAQSITFKYNGQTYDKNAVITVEAPISEDFPLEGIFLENTASRDANLRVACLPVDPASAAMEIFGICTAGGVCSSGNFSGEFTVAANSSYTDFSIHYIIPGSLSNGYTERYYLVAYNAMSDGPDTTVNPYTFIDVVVHNVAIVSAQAPSFNLYPNPASSALFLTAPEAQRVRICNVQGALVLDQPFVQGRPIDINGLPAGLYFCTIISDGKMSDAQKLVIR